MKGTRSGDKMAFALNPGFCAVVFCVEGIKQGRKRICKDASYLDLSRGERI
jgi:hypothetical protein